MSFTGSEKGTGGKPAGYFLVNDEGCTRLTKTAKADHAQVKTADNGGKYIPAGAIYPKNDATATGIFFQDTDVTAGDMPASIVTSGTVYTDRLPAAPATAAKSALEALGFKFVATAPTITRP